MFPDIRLFDCRSPVILADAACRPVVVVELNVVAPCTTRELLSVVMPVMLTWLPFCARLPVIVTSFRFAAPPI